MQKYARIAGCCVFMLWASWSLICLYACTLTYLTLKSILPVIFVSDWSKQVCVQFLIAVFLVGKSSSSDHFKFEYNRAVYTCHGAQHLHHVYMLHSRLVRAKTVYVMSRSAMPNAAEQCHAGQQAMYWYSLPLGQFASLPVSRQLPPESCVLQQEAA